MQITRDELTKNSWLVGPAIISEKETATIVSSSFSAAVRNDGCLDLRINRGESSPDNLMAMLGAING